MKSLVETQTADVYSDKQILTHSAFSYLRENYYQQNNQEQLYHIPKQCVY